MIILVYRSLRKGFLKPKQKITMDKQIFDVLIKFFTSICINYIAKAVHAEILLYDELMNLGCFEESFSIKTRNDSS